MTSARRTPECHPALCFTCPWPTACPEATFKNYSPLQASGRSCEDVSTVLLERSWADHVKADLCPAPGEPSLEKLLFAVMIKGRYVIKAVRNVPAG